MYGAHDAVSSLTRRGCLQSHRKSRSAKDAVWSDYNRRGRKLLGDGDVPAIAPRNAVSPSWKTGESGLRLSTDRSRPNPVGVGKAETPVWSPDGSARRSPRIAEAIVSSRCSPTWTSRFGISLCLIKPRVVADGAEIAFFREPAVGSLPRSAAAGRRRWAIWVANIATGSAREVWKSAKQLIDSLPEGAGGANLHWGADRLVFLSYKDGWQHLYSIPASGGEELLLTPGQFMVEHVSMAPDRRSIVYSANAGSDRNDLDRRHLFRVPIDAASPVQLTKGEGIEWSPVLTSDGKTLAHLAATARRPPLPTISPLDGRPARTLAEDRLPADFPLSKIAAPESVVVRSGDGIEVHGQVLKTDEGKARRPALLFVHGGPAQQMLLGWHPTYYANAYALSQYWQTAGSLSCP